MRKSSEKKKKKILNNFDKKSNESKEMEKSRKRVSRSKSDSKQRKKMFGPFKMNTSNIDEEFLNFAKDKIIEKRIINRIANAKEIEYYEKNLKGKGPIILEKYKKKKRQTTKEISICPKSKFKSGNQKIIEIASERKKIKPGDDLILYSLKNSEIRSTKSNRNLKRNAIQINSNSYKRRFKMPFMMNKPSLSNTLTKKNMIGKRDSSRYRSCLRDHSHKFGDQGGSSVSANSNAPSKQNNMIVLAKSDEIEIVSDKVIDDELFMKIKRTKTSSESKTNKEIMYVQPHMIKDLFSDNLLEFYYKNRMITKKSEKKE
jgi:hypothetical protein